MGQTTIRVRPDTITEVRENTVRMRDAAVRMLDSRVGDTGVCVGNAARNAAMGDARGGCSRRGVIHSSTSICRRGGHYAGIVESDFVKLMWWLLLLLETVVKPV